MAGRGVRNENGVEMCRKLADALGGELAFTRPMVEQGFGAPYWLCTLFFFQLASVSVMYQHVEAVTDVKQINRAAIGIFLCNFLTMEISVVGLLTVVFAADLATATVPMLTLVQHGVGTKMMTVVKKGYAYLGYAALITLFIPFVIHAIGTKGKEI